MTAATLPVRHARAKGWWGMVVFVATEATLFGTLVGTYVYLRFHNAHWPPGQLPMPPVLTPPSYRRPLLRSNPDSSRHRIRC